ncbi:MAG TPA: hypothetical protein VGT03_08320, partial [Candidatus Acidoferrales bacterium]|nr:hypothetical protein [Candidatus Acidoferrales bacterium]
MRFKWTWLGCLTLVALFLPRSAAAQKIIAQIPLPSTTTGGVGITVDPLLNKIYVGAGSPSAQSV